MSSFFFPFTSSSLNFFFCACLYSLLIFSPLILYSLPFYHSSASSFPLISPPFFCLLLLFLWSPFIFPVISPPSFFFFLLPLLFTPFSSPLLSSCTPFPLFCLFSSSSFFFLSSHPYSPLISFFSHPSVLCHPLAFSPLFIFLVLYPFPSSPPSSPLLSFFLSSSLAVKNCFLNAVCSLGTDRFQIYNSDETLNI